MNRPTWNNFIGKNFDDNHYAMEALARLLFRTRYGLGDSLPYFKNQAGNETEPINVNGEIIGFQSKYFEDGKIDADNILHSLETVCEKYPLQNRYIIYTNAEFGNPQKGKDKPVGLERIEQKAKANNLAIEWIFGDNVLDLVQANELAYNVFFNPLSYIHHLQKHIDEHNRIELKAINTSFQVGDNQLSFDRTRYVAKIAECINNRKSILISGESGSGKSAIIKNYCEQIINKSEYALFILNAVSLAAENVNDIFNLQEVYSLANFSSYFEGFIKKIVVIDSAEKMLDINNSSSARLFFDHLASREWLFILTCKENAVSAITDRLVSGYGLDFESVNVAAEEESYIIIFAKEHNIKIPEDTKLLKEIRIPFYFARYAEVSQCSDVDVDGFREMIWKRKVLGTGNRASQIKRETSLLDIIQQLQNSGTFIIPYENTDIEVASSLVEADILGEYPHKGFFVKHDIYTDWAIDIIIKKDFENSSNYFSVFSNDASVQYINAFKRFFLNDLNSNKQYKYISYLPLEDKITNRWINAIYECIGRSDNYSEEWFECNKDKLKENNYHRFNDFIDTLVVSCQNVDQYFSFEGKDYPLMKPTGSGWEAAVEFIWSNVEEYYQGNLQSIQKLVSNYPGLQNANRTIMRHAGLLSLRIFDIIARTRKDGGSCWFDGSGDKWSELVCRYSFSIKEEMRDRLNQVIAYKWISHSNPYSELIDYILRKANYLSLLPICLCCKKELIQLLGLFWVETNDPEEKWYTNDMRGSDYSFALNKYFDGVMGYFPSSAYQTPVYTLLESENLLSTNNNDVIKFIVEFVNSRTEVFKTRGFANTSIETIEVQLRNGGKHEVIVSECLWNLYRGTSGLAMPDLMESIHMALERYLLELADRRDDKKNVDELLWYILDNSNTCSLYAIVASVALAHPNDYLDQLLFLMQDVNFLLLDLMRHTREFHADSIEFAYYRHKDLLKERRESNALKHRNEYLEQMLLKLQVVFEKTNNSQLLDRVYGIVDSLREQVSKMDDEERALARYVILRIDARAMQQKEVVSIDGSKNIEYSTVLTSEMEAEQTKLENNNREMLKGVGLRHWIDCRYKYDFKNSSKYEYDKDIRLVLDIIRDIRRQMEEKEGGFSLLMGDQYLPFMASAVLLMQYEDNLDSDEKDECRLYLNEALSEPRFLLDSSLSGMEICLNAIPCLLEEKAGFESAAQYLVTYSLINRVNYAKRPSEMLHSVIKKNQLWNNQPQFMEYTLDTFKSTIGVDDYIGINSKQAESLLCLLAPDCPKRELILLCIEKLADYWKPKEKYDHSIYVDTFDASYMIADYWMNAPIDEVKSLVRQYKPYINGDLKHDNLISSVVLTCAQFKRYENFWVVWNEFYEGMVNNTRSYYNSSVLNSYLINPDYLGEDSDDWFLLEKKDIGNFMRIAKDMANHPSVLYSISKVFATIGKKFQIDILPVLSLIVNGSIDYFEGSLKTVTIHYLEEITANIFPTYLEERTANPSLNDCMIKILEFMQKHESIRATSLLRQI